MDIASLGIKVTTDGVAKAEAELDSLQKTGAKVEKSAATVSRSFKDNAKSAKELQFALRGVPAQFTDIATGLAQGQRPLQVFLQQGGQLKDMFGGIGPAARALGGYVLGLINPFTIAAGAAALLAVAWKQGSDEAVAYNKALITTGNYAGLTAGRMGELAQAISQTTGTQHAAAAALAEVAQSGRFTGEQVALVGKAALDMARITGQATSETIKQFESLKDKPVEAVLKLNDAQHFLTLEVYEQIKALEESGRVQEAAALAQKTYAAALSDRAQGVEENAGIMVRAWRGVAGAAKSAWDAMLDVGRDKSPGDQAQALQEQIDQLKNGRFLPNGVFQQGLDENSPEIQALRKKISDIYAKVADDTRKAREQASQDLLVQDKADSDREAAQYLTNAQKRAQAYLAAENEFNARIKRAQDAGNTALADQERKQKAVVLAGINAQYADKRRDPFSDPIGNDPRADLTASIGKEIEGYKKEAAQWARSTSAAVAYRQTLQDMLDTRQRAIDLQVASIGMSQKEIEQQQALIAIDEDYNRKKADLQKRQQNTTSALEREGYTQQLDDLEKYHKQRVQMEVDGWKRAEEARKDAALGARAAIKDFEDAAGDVAGQTYDVFSNAFDGLSDAIARFVQTGKFDFRSLVTSILADLAKMEARILASKILQSIIGGLTKGDYSNSGSSAPVTANAKGGVYDSPSLSSYSGGVYNTPHLFAFAKGAGVFGEAGPEAILPLRRGPDGKLGVAASGSGGVGDVVVNVNIQQNGDGSVTADSDVTAASKLGRQMGEQMKITAQRVLQDAMRPGGVLYKSRNGVGAPA